jgi:SAM-dependent methyltransferase
MPEFINKILQRLLGFMENVPLIPRACFVLSKSLKAPHLRQGLAEVRRLRRKSAVEEDGSKYLYYWIWLIDNAFRVVRLSLDRLPPSRILDLGSGAGYFIALSRALGHEAQGIDLGEHTIYTPVNKAFGNNIEWHRITAALPLPAAELQPPFDIITGFSITFDRHGRGIEAPPWSENDWRCFLVKIASFLRPGGILLLQLNTKNLFGCLRGEFKVFRSDVPREAGFDYVSVRLKQVELRLSESIERQRTALLEK